MRMDRHFIIESLSALDAARAALQPGERAVWHTTSPYLLDDLPRRGEAVNCMEEGLALDDIDGLGRASYEFAEKACALLNESCSWRGYAEFSMVFGMAFAHQFYATFYKGMVLERTVGRCGAVSCVGDPTLSVPKGMSPGFGRFDTVYACMAAKAGVSELDVVKHVTPADRLAELERGVRYRQMGPWEKLLSILNNTPGAFVYKTWRVLNRRGCLGTVALRPAPPKAVLRVQGLRTHRRSLCRAASAGGFVFTHAKLAWRPLRPRFLWRFARRSGHTRPPGRFGSGYPWPP